LLVFAVSVCGLLASAGAASADMLYAANGAGGNISTLYVLDANTGAVVRAVGPIGFAVTGLAIDPKSGTLYGSTGRQAADGQPNPGSLIKIDRSTGAGTLVGDERPNTETAADITFTPDGALYGWLEDVTDDLVSIDTATGAATVVGNSGLDTYGSGLASNSAGVLYFAGEGEQGRLFTIDRTSGAATPVATLNGPNGDPGISSLAFDSSGTLYGSRIPSDSPAFQSDLITIDTGTGAITSKGPSVDRLDGIAFVPPRSVTLKKKLKSHGTKVRLFGTVTDIGDPACIGGQTVQIQRKQLGGASKAAKKKKRTFRKFKKVTTKQDGSFSTKAKVTRTFKYRAFLPESSVCDDSTSKPKKVKA
jgi:hypothetical protein